MPKRKRTAAGKPLRQNEIRITITLSAVHVKAAQRMGRSGATDGALADLIKQATGFPFVHVSLRRVLLSDAPFPRPLQPSRQSHGGAWHAKPPLEATIFLSGQGLPAAAHRPENPERLSATLEFRRLPA